MGLARGDVIVAVNGKTLNDLDAVMEAARTLETTTAFTLTIDRDNGRFETQVIVR